MFSAEQKELALSFAHSLVEREYAAAHDMLGPELRSALSAGELGRQFELMIPLDWGPVDPLELQETPGFPFIYVVMGGDIYSEAIIVDEFVREGGREKIRNFEFGRP